MNPCGSKRIHEPIKQINELNHKHTCESYILSRIFLDFQMSFFREVFICRLACGCIWLLSSLLRHIDYLESFHRALSFEALSFSI